MKTKLMAVAMLAAISAPAAARMLETHDAWGMTCYPTDGPPFFVAVSGPAHKLAIGARSGRIRANQILSTRSEAGGFTVLARGIDYHGASRVLQVHFGPQSGFVDVIDRNDPAIQCGPDRGLSND